MRYDTNMKNNLLVTNTKADYADAPLALLGGISIRQFFAEYWQKKPLLVRAAIPGFAGLLDANELAGLACEDEVQSRLVLGEGEHWQLEHGPFDESRFAHLPESHWSLLVQGLNHHLPEASDLLARFSFIPHARLDDLMVSYAPDGGGVGPHFDSYDVFLLQGTGERLWRLSEQQDLDLVQGAPLKILQLFNTEQEYVLQAGDMLYLPPKVAHWGIAQGECMTYSIGFRAPSVQELAQEFLSYMQEQLHEKQTLAQLPTYQDPDLQWQAHPAQIGAGMQAKVGQMLNAISWQAQDVARFLGVYLSEPKPHIVFAPPRKLSLPKFTQGLQQTGVSLALSTQMLFDSHAIYINGEVLDLPQVGVEFYQQLADMRHLPAAEYPAELAAQLHAWYLLGYLHFT